MYCIDLVVWSVTKLVWHFSKFSTISYEFLKFQLIYTKKKKENHKRQTLCTEAPELFVNKPAV